jgi:hypothetical protein
VQSVPHAGSFRPRNADAANRSQKQFELMLSVLIGSLQQHARGSAGEAPQTSASSRPFGDTSRDANFLTRICNGKIWEDQTAFAYQLVNGLCNQLKCLDVSFGSVRNKRVKLLAISGYDSIDSRSPGSVAIEQAMTEALDAGHSILVQSDPSAELGTGIAKLCFASSDADEKRELLLLLVPFDS